MKSHCTEINIDVDVIYEELSLGNVNITSVMARGHDIMPALSETVIGTLRDEVVDSLQDGPDE